MELKKKKKKKKKSKNNQKIEEYKKVNSLKIFKKKFFVLYFPF